MAERLKVLHVGKYYPPHRGGMESTVGLLCAGLAKHVDVSVVVANDAPRTSTELLDGVRVTRAATWATVASTPLTPGLPGLLARADADIVHLHSPNPMATAAFLARGPGAPLVVTYHSDIIRQWALNLVFEPLLRRLLRRSAAIIATSPDYIDSSPVLSDFKERCRVIPFGVALESSPRPDAEQVGRLRARYGPRIVLAVGRLVYYKGLDVLIEAMRNVDGRLLVVGEGPLRAALEVRARQAGVAERVAFLGEVGDVDPYYRAADLLVLASTHRSEAFGMVQLEAMARAIPVVNTRLASGVPFVSRHGETGLTVPPGDPAELASAIRTLLADAGLRSRLGQAARRRVESEFTLELMVSRTLDVYRAVARRPI